MQKFILITGSAGFIGSHACEYFLSKGWVVIGIDNLSSGRISNISHLDSFQKDNFPFYQVDITDRNPLALEWVFDNLRPDICLHLAAVPRVSYSIASPLPTHDANITGTLNILDLCRRYQVQRLLFASSSSVYGGSEILPTPETTILNPKSPYALHKKVGEEYCKLYSTVYGLDTGSFRFFNVIGKRQYGDSPYASVIAAFCESIKNKSPVTIYGTGEFFRDFTPVHHVVDLLYRAATYPENLSGEAFNVGCGGKTTINEIADMMGITERIYKDVRAGDVPCSQADISKAKMWFEYEPKIDLKQELDEILTWYVENA